VIRRSMGHLTKLGRAISVASLIAAAFLAVSATPAGAVKSSGASFVSEPGDFIGGGDSYTFPTVTYTGQRGGYPTFSVSSATDQFDVWLAAPAGQPLTTGTYDDAQRFDFRAAGFPGLDVFGDGRGCNTVDGSFTVYDAKYDSGGNVVSFAAQFFDHCEGAYPALMGNISFNSNVTLPPIPASAPEPPQSAQFVSQTGDYLGQGQNDSFTIANPAAGYQGTGPLRLQLSNEPDATDFNVAFDAPNSGPLTVGTYANAQRYPFEAAGSPGLDVFGEGRGCNTESGSFTVYDIGFDQHGVLDAFAAEFADHCEGATPALYGLIRYNSSVSMPALPTPSTPTRPKISNLPTTASVGQQFSATVTTNSDGTRSVVSSTPATCTVNGGLSVTFIGVGTCSLTAQVAASFDFLAATGHPRSFSVGPGVPTSPTVTNIPTAPTFGTNFVANVSTTGDGTRSVKSKTPEVCSVGGGGLTVFFVGVGTCSITAKVSAGSNYLAAAGDTQHFAVNRAVPSVPVISNLPSGGTVGGSFVAAVTTTGDGSRSVTSNSTKVCTVGPDGLTVSMNAPGTCSLSPHVAAGVDYGAADGNAQAFSIS
jgi:hypothetical protein